MSAARIGRTHDLHPTASRKPKEPLTRGRRPHMTMSDIGPHLKLPQRNRLQPLSKHSLEPLRYGLPKPRGGHAPAGISWCPGWCGCRVALAARAQQPTMPVIGVLDPRSLMQWWTVCERSGRASKGWVM